MTTTKISSAVYNAWHPKLNGRQNMQDLHRLMKHAGIASITEMDHPFAARIRAAGYGMYVNKGGKDAAVVWDRSRYEMVRASTTPLTPSHGDFRWRNAAAVMLKDRETGQTFWQVSTHLSAASEHWGADAMRKRLQAEQMVQLTRLVHSLAKDGTPVMLSGDFNTMGAKVGGLKTASRIDVVYSMFNGMRHLRSANVADALLNSNHGAIISTFLAKGAVDSNGGGGNGGGGNGNGGGHNGGGNGGNGGGGGPVVTDASAYALLANLFESWGLPLGSDIEHVIRQAMKDGITPDHIDQIMPQLQDTKTWKDRFRGNEILKQKGLAVYDVPTYLSIEKSYAQIMSNFGLPKGFYDDPSDFAKFIGNLVAPDELRQRVSAYADLANREDAGMKAQLTSMGLSQGDLLAYMIDPNRANPLIQRKYHEALIGSAARNAGLTPDNNYLDHLAGQGITEDQAKQGYGLIAGSLAEANTLSNVYGENYGLSDMQAEVFDNNADASKKRKRLASQERAAFSGSAGVGSLTQNTAGSY